MVDLSADRDLAEVLRRFGIGPGDLLGWGGEAAVFALDAERVLRVLHPGGRLPALTRRFELVDELGSAGAPFALPALLEVSVRVDRVCAVERRQAGTSVLRALDRATGLDRDRLIDNHLDAAARLGDLHLAPRGWYGDLLADDAVRTASWRGFLTDRVRRSLAQAGPEFGRIDPLALADALPDADGEAFVHLDAFAGNMMTTGTAITAVIDIGTTSAVGDRHLDPVAAAVYLGSQQITANATPRDLDVVRSWLRSHDLLDRYEPTRRWLAAYWAWAVDDVKLQDWCRTVLRAQ